MYQNNKNPFNLPYKIARNQIKSSVVFRSIKKENGEFTTSIKETVEHLLESLYPNWIGNVTADSIEEGEPNDAREEIEENRLERTTNNGDATTSNNDLPFTEAEVTNIVKTLEKM